MRAMYYKKLSKGTRNWTDDKGQKLGGSYYLPSNRMECSLLRDVNVIIEDRTVRE